MSGTGADSGTHTASTAGAFQVTHRLVLSIAIPMTFGFLTTPLLGLTDTAVAGHMGRPELLAGLAIGAVIFDLIFTTLNFLRAATTGLVAQAFGEGNVVEQQAVFWRSFLLSILCGLVILLISPLLLAAGTAVMGAEGSVAEATSTYFMIRVLAAPASLANFAILGFVLGRGQGVTGLFLQTLINGVNIALCLYWGLYLGHGISGIAAATVTGEYAGAATGLALILWRFRKGPAPSMAMILGRAKLVALFGLNRDIMIRSFLLLGSFMLLTRIGSGFGAVTLAANAVLMNIFLVAGYYLDGLANAAEQLVGRAIGARYRPAFDRAVWLTGLWSLGLGAVTALFFLLFGNTAIAALTTSPEVRLVAESHLPWAALACFTGALAFQMDGVFIGATWSRDMRNGMILACLGYGLSLAVLVPLMGNHGLWLSLNLFLLFRGAILLALLPGRARRQSGLLAQ